MLIWVDAQLTPKLAGWLRARFAEMAFSLRDVGLLDAEDAVVFAKAVRLVP
ncbi:MAG: hypothetical protein ACT4OZ_06975 [Gemmatimonadota bacterium]